MIPQRTYRTIAEIAKAEGIGELRVWAAIRTHFVKSVASPSGKQVVIYNEEWRRFAETEAGADFLDKARKLAKM